MARTDRDVINEAFREAAHVRYRDLPALPHWRELTKTLHELNRNLEDGACTVTLYCEGAGWPDARWVVSNQNGGPEPWPGASHSEEVPGDGKPFRAVGAARRLLSEARSAGFK